MSEKQSVKMRKIRKHFQRADPVIFAAMADMKLEELQKDANHAGYFARLCKEIISQQLGSRAARAIVERFFMLFPSGIATPGRARRIPEEKLRATGMSWAKARSVRDLAQKIHAGEIRLRKFYEADDDTVIMELIKVKGIGTWTAEMFLMFTLGREDIFAFGDFALHKGFRRLYGARRAKTQRSMERIIQKWAPYRSYACLVLWHITDSP